MFYHSLKKKIYTPRVTDIFDQENTGV